MKLDCLKRLTEDRYQIEKEAPHASLFTTGNGYMGVRGSFEEFASVRIQGAYVRGYIGEIIEVMEPFPDNEYMKNHYFDEDKLKEFEKQESCINLPDFLLIRFFVGDAVFYPWQGKILKWNRTLDASCGVLTRTVTWDDGKGNLTEFIFERFASYADKHRYVMRAHAKAVNHSLPITAWSGIDTRAKTAGQFVTEELACETGAEDLYYASKIANSYGFSMQMGVRSRIASGGADLASEAVRQDGLVFHRAAAAGEISVEKVAEIYTSREIASAENAKSVIAAALSGFFGYDSELTEHLAVYEPLFAQYDVAIEGDDEADGYLRYANYQTLISADDDSVHSLAAKGLTGEKYNDFVWWDCEIYQLPVFIYTDPQRAKQALLYRYRMLEQSERNAKEAGYRGAKYAFCSSVSGEERVWKYARHPFLQIHINADVAYGVIHYFRATGDEAFMRDYGVEMLVAIARFWLSRAELKNGRYEITDVTGTDEHHLHVDNDAYTNYLVQFTLARTLDYAARYGENRPFSLTEEERRGISDLCEKLYLPMNENGLIPQFDGYFDLSRSLEIAGGSAAKSFQMKQSGLYHLSQVIKQPDVLLLFNYLDLEREFPAQCYRANWDYYEKMCEKASSLSFSCHAMCAADNGQHLNFLQYFMQTLRIDIDDLHHCAWQGLHSGCLAGGWLSIFWSIFGIRLREDGIHLAPVKPAFWSKVSFRFLYRGVRIQAVLCHETLTLQKESDAVLPLHFGGERTEWSDREISFSLR